MKVENVNAFLVFSGAVRERVIGGKNWLFAKVETDEGIHD
jgi:hypothetical protein